MPLEPRVALPSTSGSRSGQFEADPAGQQAHEKSVQRNALALSLSRELGMKGGGHSEADVSAVVAHDLTDGTGFGTLSSTSNSGPAVSHHPGPGTGTGVRMPAEPNDFSTEYVIWTADDGGPCEGPFYGRQAAERRLADLIAEDAENADDLSIVLAADTVEDCDGDCIGCDSHDACHHDWQGA